MTTNDESGGRSASARSGLLIGVHRTLATVGAVVVAVLAVYPPWVLPVGVKLHRLGRGWLWEPPVAQQRVAQIAWGELGAQLVAVLAVTTVVALLAGPAMRLAGAGWASARRILAPRWFPLTMTSLVAGAVVSVVMWVGAMVQVAGFDAELAAVLRRQAAENLERSQRPSMELPPTTGSPSTSLHATPAEQAQGIDETATIAYETTQDPKPSFEAVANRLAGMRPDEGEAYSQMLLAVQAYGERLGIERDIDRALTTARVSACLALLCFGLGIAAWRARKASKKGKSGVATIGLAEGIVGQTAAGSPASTV